MGPRFSQTWSAGVGQETCLEKSTYVSNFSTFFSDSIGWEIVKIRFTRAKIEFGLMILKDRERKKGEEVCYS